MTKTQVENFLILLENSLLRIQRNEEKNFLIIFKNFFLVRILNIYFLDIVLFQCYLFLDFLLR